MQNKEIWKPIKRFEGSYEVSNLGRVKSLDRYLENRWGSYLKKGNILSGSLDSNGYRIVNLSKNMKMTTCKMHLLVAKAFLGHVSCGHKRVVDHINNDRLDNRLCNLQIITHRENSSKDNFRRDLSSKYIGVSWHKSAGRWESCIYLNKKKKYLGLFDTEEEASIAYQKELTKITNAK